MPPSQTVAEDRRVSVRVVLSARLRRELRLLAAARDTSMRRLVRSLIERELEAAREQDPRR